MGNNDTDLLPTSLSRSVAREIAPCRLRALPLLLGLFHRIGRRRLLSHARHVHECRARLSPSRSAFPATERIDMNILSQRRVRPRHDRGLDRRPVLTVGVAMIFAEPQVGRAITFEDAARGSTKRPLHAHGSAADAATTPAAAQQHEHGDEELGAGRRLRAHGLHRLRQYRHRHRLCVCSLVAVREFVRRHRRFGAEVLVSGAWPALRVFTLRARPRPAARTAGHAGGELDAASYALAGSLMMLTSHGGMALAGRLARGSSRRSRPDRAAGRRRISHRRAAAG